MKAAGKRLNQLAVLSAADWRVLLTSMLLLPLIALSLRIRGFKSTRDMLDGLTPGNHAQSMAAEDEMQTAQQVAHMVSVAANHGLYRANCLKKALAAWWLLKRRGIVSELRVGVNKNPGAFSAHAWLEYQGNVLIDSADVGERFSAFDSHLVEGRHKLSAGKTRDL